MKKLLLSISLIASVTLIQAQITVSTFAGSGTPGSTDATGVLASFNYPRYVCSDAAGNIYVSDNDNRKIRKITASGVVTTFAGSGTQGSVDGIGNAASFNSPQGICVDAVGNIFVADFNAYNIRKITPTGVVTTFAGSGLYGITDATGTAASFEGPKSIAIDASGNLYVSDAQKIRKISTSGVVTTFAGNANCGSVDGTGTAASFCQPQGICIDATGNVFVVDGGNQKIRKISPAGVVTTFAGSGSQGSTNGIGSAASFHNPDGVCIDSNGNIYVADNSKHIIRKITPAALVSTLAGTGQQGFINGAAAIAKFAYPMGLCVDASNNIYVADLINHAIRKIDGISVGLKENDLESSVSIYPNPTSSVINIELSNFNNDQTKVAITNLLGEEILKSTETSNKFFIKTSHLKSGVYFVTITISGKTTTKKIIIE